MTPSEPREQRTPPPSGRADDLASLIAACGRDERPALEALYKLTAPGLYGVATAATASRADADQALVQTYLKAFAEAGQFDRAAGDPASWLAGILARHLPAGGNRLEPAANGAPPVEPPAALWQKLDIALGLERLDRHIKPGIATQARGRDPMPNAYDRRIERQLRFWRVTGVASFVGLALAVAFIGAVLLQGGPLDPLEPGATTLTAARAAVPAAEPSQLAILRATEAGRVWRVDRVGEMLRVRSLPPFDPIASGRPGVLALWGVIGPATSTGLAAEPSAGPEAERSLVRLADLDPATTTGITLPSALSAADLTDHGLELIISLEPSGGAATAGPTGPILFSGRLER
jgi:hypothetical protein